MKTPKTTTTHSDSAINSAEQDISGVKVPRGARAKFFYCIHWKTRAHGPIEALSEEEARDKWAKAHANGNGDPTPPDVCCGGGVLKDQGGGTGYYLVKGTGYGDVQRHSVTVSAEHMSKFTGTRIKAEFSGWIVYGNGIAGFKTEEESFEDDELVSIMFANPVDPSKKVAKPKLKKNEAIRRSQLTILPQ
jgi:hypothetical protein